MQGIFAQAYQRSLGRSGGQIKEGQKGIEELNDAMKKGNVLSAKVLPFVAEIAKQMAAGGLNEARMSSFAEQNRFRNQLSQGWKNFGEGGGEKGLAYFWRMMQQMGTWWMDNGATMGRYFESAMIGLDAFRLSVMELWKFSSTGESTSITDWMKAQGLDVDSIREALVSLKNAIMELFGLDAKGAGDNLQILSTRLITFVNSLEAIVRSVTEIVNGLNQIKMGVATNQQKYGVGTEWHERTRNALGDVGRSLLNYTPFGKFFNYDKNTISGGVGTVIGGVTGATSNAASSLANLTTGGGQYPYPITPSPQGWKPEGWGTTPADVGATRRSDFAPQQVNHNVRLEVTGNAEVIGALMDEKSKAQFPIFFSQELTKAMVQAPKQ